MQTYETYKHSGIEWLGEIPGHWEVEKGKWLFNKEERPVLPHYDVVTCFRDGQVTLRKNRREDGFTNSLKEIGYQGILKGDLVIHQMDAFAGAIGVSDSEGKSTPVYSVCTPRLNDVNNYYYAYLLRSMAISGVILSLAKGIRERSTDFRFNDFSALLYPLPPIHEQEAIAAFLDEKCGKIDALVEIKGQQIEKLKELRQVKIHQAVTKGISDTERSRSVEMKDSGINWIGKIPKHWEVKRLKNVLASKLKYGANESGYEYDENLPRYIRITDFGYDGKLSDEKKLSLPYNIAKEYLLKDGDILFARSGATVGKAYQFKINLGSEKSYCYAGYLIKAEPNAKILVSDFLNYYTQSGAFLNWKNSIFNKATIENIGADKYSELRVPMPPLSEQEAIVAYLEEVTGKIDQAILQKQEQIEKLKHYKQSLINEVVTGKVKVA